MSNLILYIKGLDLDYGNQHILKDLDLVQEKGEWHALIGPNGSGKTSLGLIIKGILQPTAGEVSILTENGETDPLGKKERVGFLFSNPRDQICSLTVKEDIAFGLIHQGLSRTIIKKRVSEAMDRLKIGHLAYHLTHRISGAEQQKVALAGLIALRPEYIILDEPSSFLNTREKKDLLDIMQGFHEDGISILYICNDWDEVAMADRVSVLKEKQISWSGTPKMLLKEKDTLKSAGICMPDIYLLKKRLAKEGIPLPDECLGVNQLADAISELFKKKGD